VTPPTFRSCNWRVRLAVLHCGLLWLRLELAALFACSLLLCGRPRNMMDSIMAISSCRFTIDWSSNCFLAGRPARVCTGFPWRRWRSGVSWVSRSFGHGRRAISDMRTPCARLCRLGPCNSSNSCRRLDPYRVDSSWSTRAWTVPESGDTSNSEVAWTASDPRQGEVCVSHLACHAVMLMALSCFFMSLLGVT